MTTRELFELCHMDALGLLDEQERDAFDAAFLAAPPGVQAQIRREQARLVQSDFLFADEAPPPELRNHVLGGVGSTKLRDKVLNAVRAEMSLAVPAGTRTDVIAHSAGRLTPQIVPTRRVSPVWRAAALGFASAAVAFAGATLQLRGEFERQNSDARVASGVDDMLKIRGTSPQGVLFGPEDKVLMQAEPGIAILASCWVDKSTGAVKVFTNGLTASANQEYCLVALDDSGNIIKELDRFSQLTSYQALARHVDLSETHKLAIVQVAAGASAIDGRRLLTSGPLLG